MSRLRFSRKWFAGFISIVAVLILLLGVIWVFESIGLHKDWSDIINNIFTILTALITSVTLFSLLTLWPDLPVEETRREIKQLMQRYIYLRDTPNTPSSAYTHVVENIRVRAPSARYTLKEIKDYMKTPEEGYRLAGLCIVQSLWHNDKYFDKLLSECFYDVLTILGKPETGYENYQAIETVAGVGAMERLKKKEKVDETRGMMFHLNTEQQGKLCEAVKNFKYEGNNELTSKEWGLFKSLVYEQTWCKGGSVR